MISIYAGLVEFGTQRHIDVQVDDACVLQFVVQLQIYQALGKLEAALVPVVAGSHLSTQVSAGGISIT